MGGGFEIVLACDLVVAAEHAELRPAEVTRGLMAASGGAVRLPQRLSWPLAMELLLLGEPIERKRAHDFELGESGGARPGGRRRRDRARRRACPPTIWVAVRPPSASPARSRADGEAAGWEVNAELAAAVRESDERYGRQARSRTTP